jgi:hypothetical protein
VFCIIAVPRWGRGHIVGSLVGRSVGSKAPTARSHEQTQAVVAEWLEVGGSVVDRWRGGAGSWSLSACSTGKNGLVHAAHGAAHGVCRRALVVLSWVGACRTGVVVVHIATMCSAVVTVFETLYPPPFAVPPPPL